MVGSKGSGNTRASTAWIGGKLYSDGDGRMFVINQFENKRTYLTNQQLWDRWDMARRCGGKMRVRVRAVVQKW